MASWSEGQVAMQSAGEVSEEMVQTFATICCAYPATGTNTRRTIRIRTDFIKLIGEYRVPIRLHTEVRPEILVTVTKQS